MQAMPWHGMARTLSPRWGWELVLPPLLLRVLSGPSLPVQARCCKGIRPSPAPLTAPSCIRAPSPLACRGYGPPGFARDRDVSPPMGRGPPPRDWDSWDRDAREPGGWERGERGERERGGSREREDGRPDLLRMSYDDYVAKFRQLKELQVGTGVMVMGWVLGG